MFLQRKVAQKSFKLKSDDLDDCAQLTSAPLATQPGALQSVWKIDGIHTFANRAKTSASRYQPENRRTCQQSELADSIGSYKQPLGIICGQLNTATHLQANFNRTKYQKSLSQP